MAMKKWKLVVREVLERVVEVEADCYQEAYNKVDRMYRDEEIVLDADDYVDWEIELALID